MPQDNRPFEKKTNINNNTDQKIIIFSIGRLFHFASAFAIVILLKSYFAQPLITIYRLLFDNLMKNGRAKDRVECAQRICSVLSLNLVQLTTNPGF